MHGPMNVKLKSLTVFCTQTHNDDQIKNGPPSMKHARRMQPEQMSPVHR